MDSALENVANDAIQAAPCSIEMPAGTGKTQLLAAIAVVGAQQGQRSLILTHTNAGVDAIRRRLRAFGIESSMVHVDTLTSWAFSLVRAYSSIAGVSVPESPDWSESTIYVEGATRVAGARAVAEVHRLSFDLLLVDEYQDCTVVQHDFVCALSAAIPKTIILGDRLQAIFGFAGPLADWDTHVLPTAPVFSVATVPHRWVGHNEALGQWILDIRPKLVDGQTLDLSAFAIPGLTWQRDSSPTAIAALAHGFRDFDETVVLLDKWPNDVAQHASRLGGAYSVMEDIQGRFMRDQLALLPNDGDQQIAFWLATFAKSCIVGLSGVDAVVLARLGAGTTVGHYSRNGIKLVLEALDRLLANPTYEQLELEARNIQTVPQLKVYRWEAWNDTLEAIGMTVQNGEDPTANFARIRERLRRVGRRNHSRIASRTLLVKGLEYDHVIIANLTNLRDPRNLYVALSRARKSVTIVSGSARLTLRSDS